MKYLYVFALCFLLSGANANFLDTLKNIGNQALDLGKTALQSALNELSTNGVKTLVSAGSSALLGSLLGKRDVSLDHLKALDFLKQDAGKLDSVLKSYSQQLQLIYNDIHSLNFLKGDVVEFMHKIDGVKHLHNAALDNIVQEFAAKLSTLHHNKRQLSNLLSQLQATFTSTVDKLKQTFSGVTDALSQNSGGLVSGLLSGLTNLNGGLAQKLQGAKQTAAQLLASGQETLSGLHEKGQDLAHQAVSGLSGHAQQAIDTLLHPGN